MPQALARPTAKHRARSQPPHRGAKPDAATHAALKRPASCALDIPALHKAIPKTVKLSLASNPYALINDAQIHLAIEAATRGAAKINPKETLARNIQLAASQALASAMQHAGISLRCRWWPNQEAAERGREPRESAEIASLHCDGPQCIVIEFQGQQKHRKLAGAHNALSSKALASFESVCPGFTHMVYTVLEMVDAQIWPIITPRTLWNDFIYGTNAHSRALSDADVAYGYLQECTVPEELSARYNIDDIGDLRAQDIVSLFEEEVGGVLPSFFVEKFGKAAIGGWPLFSTDARHEPIPNPVDHVREDIAVAISSMALRDWCGTAPHVISALQCMDRIVRAIEEGATLASGTYVSSNPSTSSIHLWRFAPKYRGAQRLGDVEGDAFRRVLDDAARGAWESGESVECAGWFSADASTQAQAQDALSRLQQGAATFELTLDLIHQLFSFTDPSK